MKFIGKHLILEFRDVSPDVLNDADIIKKILLKAARKIRATVVRAQFCKFEPQGVSGILFIAESHISVHTWPELGMAAVDIFTCGPKDPKNAANVIVEGFGGASNVFEIQRLSIPDGVKVNDSKKISMVL